MPDNDAAKQKAARRAARRISRGTPAWDKDRTRKLFAQYQETHDSEVRDQLIVSHLNLVRFLASKFKNRGEPLDDLIQVGTIGLIKAIDRFDPSRGLEFTTYATPTIMGEIKRHFRDKGWSVRVPRRLQELSAKVNQVTDELTTELSAVPPLRRLPKNLGFPSMRYLKRWSLQVRIVRFLLRAEDHRLMAMKLPPLSISTLLKTKRLPDLTIELSWKMPLLIFLLENKRLFGCVLLKV